MDIKTISSSKAGEIVSKDEMELLSGRIAGMSMQNECYVSMLNEDSAKTERRNKQLKSSGGHDVYNHNSITLSIDVAPKILAVILKGEGMIVSFGETNLGGDVSSKPFVLFNKWVEIFKNKIEKNCRKDNINITDAKIVNLAKYYAGYLKSIFAPVSIVFTTTYKGLNDLVANIEKWLQKEVRTEIEEKCVDAIKDLLDGIKSSQYYDSELSKVKNTTQGLNIFAGELATEEYFGDVYSTTYNASLLELKESQDYPTMKYSMNANSGEYYIPEIIKDSDSFSELWLSDIAEIADTYPEATMLTIHEIGTLDEFLAKLRVCRGASRLLEIVGISEEIFKKYEYALRMKIHPRAEEIVKYRKDDN